MQANFNTTVFSNVCKQVQLQLHSTSNIRSMYYVQLHGACVLVHCTAWQRAAPHPRVCILDMRALPPPLTLWPNVTAAPRGCLRGPIGGAWLLSSRGDHGNASAQTSTNARVNNIGQCEVHVTGSCESCTRSCSWQPLRLSSRV